MTFGDYEEWPIDEEVGEASLSLGRVRDRYLVFLGGQGFTGGHYEAAASSIYRLTHDGEARGISGDLYVLVPQYPGAIEPEAQQRVNVGYGSAQYYREDRALTIDVSVSPRLGQDDRVALWLLFEHYAKQRFPEAIVLYTTQRDNADEWLLRRAGYRLMAENRRKADGRREPHPIRTWAK